MQFAGVMRPGRNNWRLPVDLFRSKAILVPVFCAAELTASFDLLIALVRLVSRLRKMRLTAFGRFPGAVLAFQVYGQTLCPISA